MNILLCHNFYQQPGGEDQSFAAEARLLESRGHDVIRYTMHNDAIDGMGRWDVVRRTFWNAQAFAELRELIRRHRPALMHCTNIFPLISPAAYDAARAEGIPVVQSLRNYRLLCPNAFFFREGRVCEDCQKKRFAWPGIVHKCYRDSRAATALVAAMAAAQRCRGTWDRAIDVFFTPSEFARQKFVAAGFPPEKILVKPNFIDPDPGPGQGKGGYAVFVGRLSPEKGLDVLLDSWQRLDGSLALKIVGDGPLRDVVQTAAKANPAIRWLGRQPPAQVLSLVGNAACLVMPSIWYETFGRTIVEAFARGTPVIASHLGAMAELVEDGTTGWLFKPGDAADLAAKVNRLLERAEDLPSMRRAARDQYRAEFTAEANYRMLISIYERALATSVPTRSQRSRTAVRSKTASAAKLLRRLPRFRQAYRSLPELAEREQWSRSDIDCFQLERLNAVWSHAVLHVPYYRDLRAAADLPTRFTSLEDFRAAVPVLPRQNVQADPTRFCSVEATAGRWQISGGSTGSPTGFFWPHAAHHAVMQAKYRFQAMWGLDILDRFAFLWGHTASFAPGLPGLTARWTQPVADRLRNRLRLSAYQLGSRDLQRHLMRMERFQPAALYGYSTAVYLLAEESMAAGTNLKSLKAVILTSEPALDFIVRTTQDAFGVPAVIEYGAAECGLIAGQWPDGTLRVREDIVMVETLPREDGHFDVLLTVLVNRAFPLLRYVIGDVTDAPLKTPDRGFAILESVIGRQNDFLWSRSGTRIHPTLPLSIIEQTAAVRRYQVRQSPDGSIRVQVEPRGPGVQINTARIASGIREAVEGYPVSVEVTNSVGLSRAGKHRWIVSDFAGQDSFAGRVEQVAAP